MRSVLWLIEDSHLHASAHKEPESMIGRGAGNHTIKKRGWLMMIILVMIGNYIFSENCWFPAKLATWQHSHTLFSKLLALIFESAHTLFQWCELDFRNKGAPTCFPLPERKRFSRVWLDDCSAQSICGCGRVLPDSSGTWSHSFTQKINPQCVLARIDRFQPEGRWKPTVDLLTGKNQCWCNITEN